MNDLRALKIAAILAVVAFCSSVACGGGQTGLVHYYADWCLPCRNSQPVMQQLASEGYAVTRVDVTPDPCGWYRRGIQQVPTFVLLRDGVAVWSITGEQRSSEPFRAAFRQFGITPRQPLIVTPAPPESKPPATAASGPMPGAAGSAPPAAEATEASGCKCAGCKSCTCEPTMGAAIDNLRSMVGDTVKRLDSLDTDHGKRLGQLADDFAKFRPGLDESGVRTIARDVAHKLIAALPAAAGDSIGLGLWTLLGISTGGGGFVLLAPKLLRVAGLLIGWRRTRHPSAGDAPRPDGGARHAASESSSAPRVVEGSTRTETEIMRVNVTDPEGEAYRAAIRAEVGILPALAPHAERIENTVKNILHGRKVEKKILGS